MMKKIKTTRGLLCTISAIMALALSCSKDEERSAAKEIEALVFLAKDNAALKAEVTASVDEANKKMVATVPFGTQVDALLPTLKLSEGASYAPQGAQDFSDPITYTVTAENGSSAEYTVTVRVADPGSSPAKEIEGLVFLAKDNAALKGDVMATIVQEGKKIVATVPFGTQVDALLPTLELSEGASYAPQGAQDFSDPITYTVTAENGSSVEYTVTVPVQPQSQQ